jgi:hypothetical protein
VSWNAQIMRADNAFVVVLFILIIAAIAIIAAISALKRRRELAELARRKGFLYSPRDVFGLPNAYEQTHLCSQGHSKKASNLIYGTVGESEVRYFDYRYTVGSGKNSHTYYKSAFAVQTPYRFTPMLVRPEGVFDKVAGFFGFDDIDLDLGEFNRKFFVRSEDKKFAYDVLSQRAMQFFLERGAISMEMRWNYCIFYYNGTLKPAMVERLMDDALEFMKLLPHYLTEERRFPAASRGATAAPSAPPKAARRGGSLEFDGIEPKHRRRRT